jgi:hypothetical protein
LYYNVKFIKDSVYFLLTIRTAPEGRVMSHPRSPSSPQPAAGGAIILPFPARAASRRSPPVRPDEDRLTRALASLDAALTEQRQAVAAWRDSLHALRQTTEGLGSSLRRYDGVLGTLNDRVAGLNTQARQLERWADKALQSPG